VAAKGRRAGGLHHRWFSSQQRVHLAAFLIAIASACPAFAQDISFDPAINQAEFRQFARVVGQAIFASPVQPARASGILGFDVGVAASVVKIDQNSAYWRAAVPQNNDFTTHGYVGMPRLVVSKGFSAGTISGMYSKVSNSGIKTYGAALDSPIIRGGLLRPELALRLSYSTLTGVDVFHEKTYGAEVFLSKGFGPVTPYAAVGRMRTSATGDVPAAARRPAIRFSDTSNLLRYTAGVRLSLLIPKLVVEATQAEVRSYAAKISIGF
jgi:hypothetical protein